MFEHTIIPFQTLYEIINNSQSGKSILAIAQQRYEQREPHNQFLTPKIRKKITHFIIDYEWEKAIFYEDAKDCSLNEFKYDFFCFFKLNNLSC